MDVPSCNNAGVYLTSITLHARTFLHHSHNRLPLAYIHQKESDLPPTSYSVSEELHLHSLILYSRSSICIYRNSINFRHGLIFVNFGHTKNTEIYPHMRMQFHKKIYCTGQNDEIKSRRKLKILEKFGNVRN